MRSRLTGNHQFFYAAIAVKMTQQYKGYFSDPLKMCEGRSCDLVLIHLRVIVMEIFFETMSRVKTDFWSIFGRKIYFCYRFDWIKKRFSSIETFLCAIWMDQKLIQLYLFPSFHRILGITSTILSSLSNSDLWSLGWTDMQMNCVN